MASTAYKDTRYTLMHMIEEIKHGKIALPDIQRPFVWSDVQVRDLFDSMYRGYPIGTLMFWETGADVGVRPVGGGPNEGVAKLLIVDGQQRLTSLYAVMTGKSVIDKKFQQKRIRIAFCPRDEIFEVTDAAIERDPEFIADITKLWAGRFKTELKIFLDRLQKHRGADLLQNPNWDDEQDLLEDRIDRVRDLRDFGFRVVELSDSADEEQVAEIFVRTNAKGVLLKQFDFILTLMSVHWDKGRRQLEQFCRQAVDKTAVGLSPRNVFIEPRPDQMLRVGVGLAFKRGRLSHIYNILRGKDLETGHLHRLRRTAQFETLAQAQDKVLDLGNWHEFLKCLSAAGFRSDKMITSQTALLYTYVLWLVGRCDFGIDLKTLRSVIARWFFMAHTTGRYTNSSETAIEADLGRVAPNRVENGQTFCDELDRIVRSAFTSDYWNISLPNLLDTTASKSPALSAYQAALNILDAEVLFSDQRIRDLFDPAATTSGSVPRHHLFSKAYLATQGVTETSKVNAVSNMAYLDRSEKVRAPGDNPLTYWPALTERIAPARLHRWAHWHGLPVGWEQLDYPTFLKRRRKLLAQVVRDAFELLWEDTTPTPPEGITELLRLDESETLEFKSTVRWNMHAQRRDKRIEHTIVKTVCGFLNAQGGKLIIGVNDKGEVLGLGHDLRTLGSKANLDDFELFLRKLLNDNLSIPTVGTVGIGFESVAGNDVCVVSASSSGKPVFAKPENDLLYIEFWVRVGNATMQLHGNDMLDYRSNHWGV